MFPGGLIIAFEGLDCSFKETNFKAFVERLKRETGKEDKIITESFPRYNTLACDGVTKWLRGSYDREFLKKYPKAINSLYAIDRLDYWAASGGEFFEKYNSGEYCFVFDRYAFSSSVYNPTNPKAKDVVSIDDFVFERKDFGIPQASIIVWMRMSNFDKLADFLAKKEDRDKNETDLEFLKEVWTRSEYVIKHKDTYEDETGVKILPIDCINQDTGEVYSKVDLENIVWDKITTAINDIKGSI